MKKQIYTTAATMILLAVCAVAPTKAQSNNRMTLKATIPFAFSVGNTTLPAGEYIIAGTNSASDQTAVLHFRSKDGRASTLVLMHKKIGKASETAKLVFNQYGDRYFFAQAWTPNDGNGMEAPKSRAERPIERELARAGKKSELVAVKAR